MNNDNNQNKPVEQKEDDRPLRKQIQDEEKKPTRDIKSVISDFGQTAVGWLKRLWTVVWEWLKGKRGGKNDRLALALCFVLAIGVWLYVMSTNDTGFKKSINSVPVEIEGASALSAQNLSIINGYGNLAEVTLKGRRADIGTLTSEDIRLSVDVSKIEGSGRQSLPIIIEMPKNSTLVSIEPSHIDVNVDVNSSREIETRVKLEYILDASFSLSEPIPNYKTVIVSGPASVLNSISYAAVSFSPGKIDKSINLVGTLRLYDEYDNVITNPYLKCNVSEITVTVNVNTKKTVPLTVKFSNGNSSPYQVVVNPSTVTLIGDPLLLKDITEVPIYTVVDGEISVGELFYEYIDTSEYNLPEGVTVENPEKGAAISITRKY